MWEWIIIGCILAAAFIGGIIEGAKSIRRGEKVGGGWLLGFLLLLPFATLHDLTKPHGRKKRHRSYRK